MNPACCRTWHHATDHVRPCASSPTEYHRPHSPSRSGHTRQLDDDFQISEGFLRDLLHQEGPVPHEERFAPTRGLLVLAFKVTHGKGCTLELVKRSIDPTMRRRALVDVWRKLTGDSRSDSMELYTEARLIYCKRMFNGARTPSMAMRAWLEEAPMALAIGSGPVSPPLPRKGVGAGGVADAPSCCCFVTGGKGERRPTRRDKEDSSDPTKRGAWPGDKRLARPSAAFASTTKSGLRALQCQTAPMGTAAPGVGSYDTWSRDMSRSYSASLSPAFSAKTPRTAESVEAAADRGPQISRARYVPSSPPSPLCATRPISPFAPPSAAARASPSTGARTPAARRPSSPRSSSPRSSSPRSSSPRSASRSTSAPPSRADISPRARR